MNQTTIDMIDWEAIKSSVKSRTNTEIKFLTKLDSKFLPVGTKMEQRRKWPDQKCKICEKEDEDVEHLFKCSSEEAEEIRREEWVQIIIGMRNYNTDPMIERCIMHWLISKGERNFSQCVPEGASMELMSAAVEQD